MDSLRQTAYHEAGHAVAAVILNTGLDGVDIRPRPIPGRGEQMGRGGAGLTVPCDELIFGFGEESIMPLLVTLSAGWIAEQIVNPEARIESEDPVSDGQRVAHYATHAVGRRLPGNRCAANIEQCKALLEAVETQTRAFVKRYQSAIASVAERLIQSESLTTDEVEEIVKAHLPH